MKKTKTNNADRISDLSNNLLVMIISFLPFKEAARTSVLAKKWHNVWRASKNVEFDETFFTKKNEDSDQSRRNFIVFSKNWCQSYPGKNINNFRLAFSNPGNYIDDLGELVKFAIDHDVKGIELDFSDPSWDKISLGKQEPVFELPKFVYEHSGLESIKLYSSKVKVSEFKNPGGILNFSLGWTNLSNKEFNSFLVKCSFLESLSLEKCWNAGGLDINAPFLKSLVIDKCLKLDGVEINAKSLNCFKYSGEIIYFDIEYMKKMEVAEIDFANEDTFGQNGDYLYNLLNELWSTKVLTVCSYLLQVIPNSEECPNLECAEHLILKTQLHKYEYHGITYMLKSCPNLQTLTFDLGPARIFYEVDTYLPLEYHPFLVGPKYDAYGPLFNCLKTLKSIVIKGFKGEHYETKVIKYFINYGIALENVCVTLSKDKGVNGIDMTSTYRLKAQSLMTCPKASRALEFVIEN